MSFRNPALAPESMIAPERRGRILGRFCLTCSSVFPLHAGIHRGKGIYSKDHIVAPCSHEGEAFEPGADWWEPAVEVLPEAPAEATAEASA